MPVVVWPFATESPSQFSQVDQGWDLNDSPPGGPVFAIASGTIAHILDDPSGFGHHYPVMHLDGTIGGPTQDVYYGHVTATVPVGTHVAQGQQIATTHTASGDGNGGPGHLEIGFADSAGNPAQRGSGATADGAIMKSILLGATPDAAHAVGTSSSTSSGGGCPDFFSDPGGAIACQVGQLLGDLPKDFLKVLLGDTGLGELAIRAVELLGGALLTAVGLVMFVKLVAGGGETGRTISATRRSASSLRRAGSDLAAGFAGGKAASHGAGRRGRQTFHTRRQPGIGRPLSARERRGGSYPRYGMDRGRSVDLDEL